MEKNIKQQDSAYADSLGVDLKTLARFREVQKNTMAEAKKMLKTKKKLRALGISGSARDEFDMAGESSNSEYLLNECLLELKKLGAEIELLPLRKYDIKPCKACYSTTNNQCHFQCSCYKKGTELEDDMSKVIYDKLLAADIIIFATPVNNFKVSSLMALFIDRCISLDGSLEAADLQNLKNKDLNKKHAQFVSDHADDEVFGSGFLRRFTGKTAGIIVTGHEAGASLTISSLFLTLNNYGFVFPAWSTMYAMGSILDLLGADKAKVTSPYAAGARDIAHNTFIMAQKMNELPKDKWRSDPSRN